MCEPISATTMATIAAGTAIAGTGVSVYSAIQQGNAAKASANYNAEMQRRAADDALQRGSISAAEHRDKVRQMIASQDATMAGGGADITSGSPLKLTTDTAGMGELDALRILNNSQREASGLNAQAENTRYTGRMAQRAGYMNAAGSLLSGASAAYTGYRANLK